MGSDDNGPDMFAKMEEVTKEYNECNLSSGGKAKLQIYERCDVFDDLSQDTPPQKKRKVKYSKPMILAVCTPLMSRANESIQQAEEMIFCDSISTLLKFGCYGSTLKDVYFAAVLSQHHEGVKECLLHTFKVLHLRLTPLWCIQNAPQCSPAPTMPV